MAFLRIVSVEERTSRTTNKPYTVTTFQSVKKVEGEWFLTGDKERERIGDPIGKEGNLVLGRFMSFETTPYSIEGRKVNKITVVVFDSDEKPIDLANAQLKNNNACVIVNGKPTLELQAASPIGQDLELQAASPIGQDLELQAGSPIGQD